MSETAQQAAPMEDWPAELDDQAAARDARRLRVQLRRVIGLVLLAAAAILLIIAIGPAAGAAGGCGGG
jgi:hypothetical protein